MLRFLLSTLIISLCYVSSAQVKILFDASKAETAGNADWVIDADVFNLNYNNGPATTGGGREANAQRIPTAPQSNITNATAETYWNGGLSYWGTDCVKQGYQVETLPYNGAISYGNASNTQDLSYYNIFVVPEPNILFTASEKIAIITFVQNGGSLFIIADHNQSDRNNDGYDSPTIWNDLFTNNGIVSNPFGISFDLTTISGSSSNVTPFNNDSLIHGSYGNVLQVLWSSGTTMTINPAANSSVRGAVYKSGSSNTGTSRVMVAYARFGLGKVVAVGDSSPFDDGTGDVNDQLYDGYIADANGNHKKMIMNATVWLATTPAVLAESINFTAIKNNGTVSLNWVIAASSHQAYFNIEKSNNGKDFYTLATVKAGNTDKYAYTDRFPSVNNSAYYRLLLVNKDGSKEYSKIVAFRFDKNLILSIYPNPAKDFLIFNREGIRQIKIFDNLGSTLISRFLFNNAPLDISTLKSGIYFVQAIYENGDINTQRLLKD